MAHDHHHHHDNCGCGADHGADPHGPRPPVAEAPRPWRPAVEIKPIAIAIILREDQVLAGPVHGDSGQIIGWRPLGGEIGFGEQAAEALAQAFQQSTGQEISELSQIGVLENHFEHEGRPGHEIVFIFSGNFSNQSLYEADQLAFTTPDAPEMTAKWIPLAKARAGRVRLFPEGLCDLI